MIQKHLKAKFGKVAPKEEKPVSSPAAKPKSGEGKTTGKKTTKNKEKKPVETPPVETPPVETPPVETPPQMPAGLTEEEKRQWEAENEWQSDPQAQKDDF